ncbi:hypothetical protein BKA66DRAFT_250480 [Pyrenochaeta sp. MPI-SDFR-AT-0127]|nr:hypothetical protein BKA66DRAFT_250480 [Pyrenochaeta sp. MPI-SDFR-AT-0127]
MRFQATVAAFAASLAFAGAQDLTGVPTCALPCFVAALPASGCGITDTVCQCTTGREAITNSILGCAPSRCAESDVASIAPAVQALCAKAGVTITDVPTAASTASGSAAATSAASSSANAASSAANAASSAVAAASSAASAASSALSAASSIARTASATGSAAATATPNAAPGNVAGLGAIAMGLAAGVMAL